MFGFILGILVILAGIIFGIVAICNDEKGPGIGTLIGGIVLGIVIILLGCFVSIGTGKTGIVTTFGRVEDYTLEAGVHTKAPWNKVIEMDNRVQKKTVELSCFSSDIQEVSMRYTINYQIDKEHAQIIYKTIGTKYYETVIEPTIAECVKVSTAKFTAEQLVQTRSNLAVAIEALLAENLAAYNINISSTAIEDMDFTDVFTNAVEAKQVAEQQKKQAAIEYAQALEKAENEKEIALRNADIAKTQAEAEAAKAKIAAEAEAEVAKIKAEADLEVQKKNADANAYAGQKEAEKNKAITASINEDLIKYYQIQQWNGEYPNTYMGDSNVSTILDIGK